MIEASRIVSTTPSMKRNFKLSPHTIFKLSRFFYNKSFHHVISCFSDVLFSLFLGSPKGILLRLQALFTTDCSWMPMIIHNNVSINDWALLRLFFDIIMQTV